MRNKNIRKFYKLYKIVLKVYKFQNVHLIGGVVRIRNKNIIFKLKSLVYVLYMFMCDV